MGTREPANKQSDESRSPIRSQPPGTLRRCHISLRSLWRGCPLHRQILSSKSHATLRSRGLPPTVQATDTRLSCTRAAPVTQTLSPSRGLARPCCTQDCAGAPQVSSWGSHASHHCHTRCHRAVAHRAAGYRPGTQAPACLFPPCGQHGAAPAQHQAQGLNVGHREEGGTAAPGFREGRMREGRSKRAGLTYF